MDLNKKSAFSILLGSSVAGQAILVACSILFARLYDANAFGSLGQITGVASIATVVIGLRFDHMAFSKPDEQKLHLHSAAFFVMIVVTAAVLLAAITVVFVDRSSGIGYLWMALFVAANGSYYLCSQLQIAEGNYFGFGRVRIFQAVIQLLVGGLLFASLPTNGMLLAAIVSQAAAAILVVRNGSARKLKVWDAATVACIRLNMKAAATNSASSLLQYSTPFAPMVLGAYFFQKGEIGAYFLFSSAVAAPCAVLRRAILSYFNGEIKSPDHIRAMLAHALRRVRFLLIPGFVVTLLLLVLMNKYSDILAALLFGRRWSEYSALLLPLAVFFVLDTLLQPFSTFLAMWGHERVQIKLEVLRFVMTYLAWPLIVHAAGLHFISAIVLYLALMLFVYVLNLAIVLRAVPAPDALVLR